MTELGPYHPGDILLVRDYAGPSDLLGNLILAGNRARHSNTDASRWTHSALIVSPAGDLIEADANGIQAAHVSDYAHVQTAVCRTAASDEQRQLAVQFAQSQEGTGYDVLDFIALAFSLLTGLAWSLHSERRSICSGLCSRATEKAIVGYPFPPEAMLPADLAVYWNVASDAPLPPLSLLGRCLDVLRHVVYALSPFTHGLRP